MINADNTPSLPHSFFGTLTINGSPAPAETIVEARGSNVLTGIAGNPLHTTEKGRYGRSDRLGSKLVVQGNITQGTALAFYINGTAADQTAAWQSGGLSELNLSVTISDNGGRSPGNTGNAASTPTPSASPESSTPSTPASTQSPPGTSELPAVVAGPGKTASTITATPEANPPGTSLVTDSGTPAVSPAPPAAAEAGEKTQDGSFGWQVPVIIAVVCLALGLTAGITLLRKKNMTSTGGKTGNDNARK